MPMDKSPIIFSRQMGAIIYICEVYAAMKSIVFRQFSLGYGIEIRQFWSRN